MAFQAQDPNELIAKQFGEARKGLVGKQRQAQDTADMAVARNQALTGLSGGAALKAKENAMRAVDEGYNDANAQLTGQEAQAKIGASQFQQQQNLAEQQAAEQKRQFGEQMAYQNKEFSENQKTNLINAATALEKAGFLNVKRGKFGEAAGVSDKFKDAQVVINAFRGLQR